MITIIRIENDFSLILTTRLNTTFVHFLETSRDSTVIY